MASETEASLKWTFVAPVPGENTNVANAKKANSRCLPVNPIRSHGGPPIVDIAAIQQMIDKMFPGVLGVKVESISPDRVTASMLVRPELCTAGATLHGGAFMAFADTMGAIATIVNLPPGHRTTTLESKTNFLSGAAAGTRVTSETTAFHKGRMTQVWQTKISNADGKLCAVVTQTQMVIPSSR